MRDAHFHPIAIAALLPLALAACGGAKTEADGNVDANGVDPALASALHDQIMVDPQLTQQSNDNAVRPPAQPASGAVPADNVAAGAVVAKDGDVMHAPAPVAADKNSARATAGRQAITLGGLAARQGNPSIASCVPTLQYSAAWAQRLPAQMPLYPQAHVTEAAGSQAGKCTLRVVSFYAPVAMQNLIDWYYTKAMHAGYASEHQTDGDQHILGGTRVRDGAAYVLYLSPRPDGGTDIDMVANNGV